MGALPDSTDLRGRCNKKLEPDSGCDKGTF